MGAKIGPYIYLSKTNIWHHILTKQKNSSHFFNILVNQKVISGLMLSAQLVSACLIDQVYLLMRSLPQKAGHLDSHLVSPRVIRSSLTAFLCLISCHIHLCVKPCVP